MEGLLSKGHNPSTLYVNGCNAPQMLQGNLDDIVQCSAVCSVKCFQCSAQYAVHSAQWCNVFTLQCVVYSAQCIVCSVRCTVQHSTTESRKKFMSQFCQDSFVSKED